MNTNHLKLNNFHFVDFCLDAKLKFDDNAEFRQKAIFNERDLTQEDPLEVEAFKYDLNYIALDGKIFLTYIVKMIFFISIFTIVLEKSYHLTQCNLNRI